MPVKTTDAAGGAGASRSTKSCPYCAEDIQGAAIICRYCGRRQDQPDSSSPIANWKGLSPGIVVATTLLVLYAVTLGVIYFAFSTQGTGVESASVAVGAESTTEPRLLESSLVNRSLAFSVVIVAVTLSLVILGLGYRLVRGKDLSAPTVGTWQTGLLAGSIALFGILITGVFFFMTFQVDAGAQRAAELAAREGLSEATQSAIGDAEEAARQVAETTARDTATAIANQEIIRIRVQMLATAEREARQTAQAVADEVAERVATDVARDTAGASVNPLEGELDELMRNLEWGQELNELANAAMDPEIDGALRISVGGSSRRRVNERELAMFEVELPGGDYRFEATANGNLDLQIFVWRQDGDAVALEGEDDDGGPGLDPRLDLNRLPEGGYYVGVGELQGRAGTYDLTVEGR